MATDSLVLYQLGASPNSIKCRLALGLKKIPCQIVDTGLDEEDDRKIVELSGQALRPILVHDGRAVYDSHAILRYLDANWKNNGPRIFGGADQDAQHDIEEWERFAYEELRTSIGMIFGQMFAKSVDPKETAEACALLARNCARIEEALSKTAYLMGEQPNAADLTAAAFVGHGLLDAAQKHPFNQFFSKHLRLPEKGFDRTRAWCKRLLAHDPAPI